MFIKGVIFMSKKIAYNESARKALEKGMSILAKTVALTLGPKGKNVVLENRPSVPQITNDGVTIVKEIELVNQLENMGVALLRQAASKTNDVAGDGTTTATVLAYAIVQQGMKSVAAGVNPTLIKKGMSRAVHFIVNKISEYSRPVNTMSDIAYVASVSAGNDSDMGLIIAKAIKKVGREGIVHFEEGHSVQSYLEISKGTSIDKGFISPHFLSRSDSIEICQDNPLILLIDNKIALVKQDLIPLLEQVASVKRSLLIIADSINEEALSILIMNRLKGIVDVVVVPSPGLGNIKKCILEDLAILTGACVISEDFGISLNEISLDIMGSARRVIVSKNTTKIIPIDNNEAVGLRCRQINKQIDLSTSMYEKENLQHRLSSLTNKVAIIKVGAATEAEMRYKKLRFEDAISAANAAIDEGIVPGGGAALLHLAKQLDLWTDHSLSTEEIVGMQIVSKALLTPLIMIIENTGLNGALIAERIQAKDFAMGYDANKSIVVDMYEAGIVDPAKVTRSALQNAFSVASAILTTECIISD